MVKRSNDIKRMEEEINLLESSSQNSSKKVIKKRKKTVKKKVIRKKTTKKVIKKSTVQKKIARKTVKKKTIKKTVKRPTKKKDPGIFKRLIKSFAHKEEKEKKRLDSLQNGAIRRLNALSKQKINSKTVEEINKIFRIVLNKRYKIKTSLTVEEISKKIKDSNIRKNIKSRILYLLVKIRELEYGDETLLTKESLEKVLNELKKTIRII